MNEKIKEYGLKETVFKNSTGLDEEGHYSSAYDMAIVAKELLKHEEVLKYSSVYEDYLRVNTPNKFWLVNTNKLVRFYEGADGLKTGFTDAAGYCMTVTSKRAGMRLIAVVLGEKVSKTRNEETTELLDYGFNLYKINLLKKKTDLIDKIKIEKGTKESVGIYPKVDISILMKKSDAMINYDTEVKMNDIKLPIKKGDIVGKLLLKDNGKTIKEVELVTSEDISKINYFKYLWNSFTELISGEIKD